MFNEEKVLNGCRKGKTKCQRLLYEHFHRKMFAIALRYCKTRLDAEDVLQESFIKVFKKIKDFRGDCPLEFWVKRIVINTALKQYRSKLYQYPQQDIEELYDFIPDQETPLSRYSFKELLKLIQELPEKCQVVFNLYAVEGYQHKEIADMLNISTGTSKSQYSRAKYLLQKKIKQQETVKYESYRGK